MTHAYSESYLNNAKDRLSSFFDYAINDCKLKPDWITALFINTGYAEQFERGSPFGPYAFVMTARASSTPDIPAT